LKLYAIRLEQQRFAVLGYARNPCPEAVWINLEPHFSDFEAVVWFWHGEPLNNVRPLARHVCALAMLAECPLCLQ
jgi:hypothetical protein